METTGFSHVAMAVPPGALTAEHRDAILAFYGEVFGWREIEDLRRPDRLTIAIANRSYLNLREHPTAAELTYEHFGVLVRSADAVTHARQRIVGLGVDAGPIEEPVAGSPTFRFQHLLPMAIEVQHVP